MIIMDEYPGHADGHRIVKLYHQGPETNECHFIGSLHVTLDQLLDFKLSLKPECSFITPESADR